MKNPFWPFSIELKNKPPLDEGFLPFYAVERCYNAFAEREAAISLRRGSDSMAVERLKLFGTPQMHDADVLYLERRFKHMLWQKGGYAATFYGCDRFVPGLSKRYAENGLRAFDAAFMQRIYERPLSFQAAPLASVPNAADTGRRLGGYTDGCRIGLDAGGSAIKAVALKDGKMAYQKEIPWQPKAHADMQYHIGMLSTAFSQAAAQLPRVDAIGVSSAGVFVDNECRVASLFIGVPQAEFQKYGKTIYTDAARRCNAPLAVCNDGDIAALSGMLSENTSDLLGISMGTSLAAGFVDDSEGVMGWLNELAFTPVDLQEGAPVDEWSGDTGVGCKYFSQDAAIRLAPRAGIKLPDGLETPPQKMRYIMELLFHGDPGAKEIFRTIGCYLGHTLPLYHSRYGMKTIMLMGGALYGTAGEIVRDEALRVVREEYPECIHVTLLLQAAGMRSLGQAAVAAGLLNIAENIP